MKSQEFFICNHCGNIAVKTVDAGPSLVCCGEKMVKLEANTEFNEKHTPQVTVEGNTVKVVLGQIAHPMTEKHYIQFIYLETQKGGQRVKFNSDDKAEATFALTEGDKVVAAYAYCNLHGLWETIL